MSKVHFPLEMNDQSSDDTLTRSDHSNCTLGKFLWRTVGMGLIAHSHGLAHSPDYLTDVIGESLTSYHEKDWPWVSQVKQHYSLTLILG